MLQRSGLSCEGHLALVPAVTRQASPSWYCGLLVRGKGSETIDHSLKLASDQQEEEVEEARPSCPPDLMSRVSRKGERRATLVEEGLGGAVCSSIVFKGDPFSPATRSPGQAVPLLGRLSSSASFCVFPMASQQQDQSCLSQEPAGRFRALLASISPKFGEGEFTVAWSLLRKGTVAFRRSEPRQAPSWHNSRSLEQQSHQPAWQKLTKKASRMQGGCTYRSQFQKRQPPMPHP